jgi:hypothetical protein
MEHPLITGLDALSVEELSQRISDLSRKLQIAQSTGNAHLCNQIRMALESHRNKYQERAQQTYAQQIKDTSLDNKIQIK